MPQLQRTGRCFQLAQRIQPAEGKFNNRAFSRESLSPDCVLNNRITESPASIAKLEKYRKYLVTDEQRKLVSDFVLTINKFGTGEPAIPFSGTSPEGKKISPSDFKGEVVLVDVWATWCVSRLQIKHL